MSCLFCIFVPIVLILVFAASLTIRAAGSPQSSAPAQPEKTPAAQTPLPPAREIATFGKTQLRQMLAKIESSPAPKPKMGAMCYKMAAPPNRAEYTCPVCNHKTLHVLTNEKSWDARWLLGHDLTAARRLIKEVQKHAPAARLRENDFCDHCNPQRGKPNLGIAIRYDDGTETATDNISSEDLRILLGFFSGKLAYTTSNDGTVPFRGERTMQRLKQLLGEPLATTPPPSQKK